MPRAFFIVVSIYLVALAMLLLLGTQVFAHMAPSGWKYPLECCSNMDCAPVPAKSLRFTPSGVEVRLTPDMHKMVTGPSIWIVPYKDMKPSPDGEAHACISRKQRMLCLFVPPMGV